MGYLARMPVTPEWADEVRVPPCISVHRVDTPPALQQEIFDSLCHLLDKAVLTQIYSEFLAQTRLRVHALTQSADPQVVQAMAHTIKGTAGMLGADRIAAAAKQLEDDPATGSDLSAALAEIAEGCTALEAALNGKQVLG